VSETVIVVPEPGPDPAPAAPPAEGGVAAGMALVVAEGAAQDAAAAAAVAEGAAAAVAEIAAEAVACCEHCMEHAERLASLEEGRGAELAAKLEQVELDAPAPPVKEKPVARPKAEPAEPKVKRGMWPV
jgi:hypothetical protein